MTSELEDFDPVSGHRHACEWAPSRYGRGVALCDCATELYAVAAVRLDPSAVIDKIGPLDGDHVLVVRGAISPFGNELIKELVRQARARGLTGKMANHVPIVVTLAASQSLEDLDETEMNKIGWFRHRTGMGKPIPAGPYS